MRTLYEKLYCCLKDWFVSQGFAWKTEEDRNYDPHGLAGM